MPGHKPAATRDYSFYCRINHIHWWNNSHCTEATLNTSSTDKSIRSLNTRRLLADGDLMRIHCKLEFHNHAAYSLWKNQELITLLKHQLQSLMMGLNLIIYVSHSSVNPAQSLNNICPGDLTSKARAGNHQNVVLPCTEVDHKNPWRFTAGRVIIPHI